MPQPWWVNLVILVPLLSFYVWRKKGLVLSGKILLAAGIFGIAFGFVEAAVIVYLRAALGLLPGFGETISAAVDLQILTEFPKQLLAIEILREVATIIMLGSVAFLAVKTKKERWAIFLWAFAFWDIFYYVGLRFSINWPESFTTPDILFLIPSPWFAPVWFPLLVSGLTLLAVIITARINKSLTFLSKKGEG